MQDVHVICGQALNAKTGKGTKRKPLCLSFGNPKKEIYIKHCLNSTRKSGVIRKNNS
jgi:hypothetical protein